MQTEKQAVHGGGKQEVDGTRAERATSTVIVFKSIIDRACLKGQLAECFKESVEMLTHLGN